MAETEELSLASKEAAIDMMIGCAVSDLMSGLSIDSIETLLAAMVRYPSEARVRWVLATIVIVECIRNSYNAEAIVSQQNYSTGSTLHLFFREEGKYFSEMLQHIGEPLPIFGDEEMKSCVVSIYDIESGSKCISRAVEYLRTQDPHVIYGMRLEREELRLSFCVQYESDSILLKRYAPSDVQRSIRRAKGRA